MVEQGNEFIFITNTVRINEAEFREDDQFVIFPATVTVAGVQNGGLKRPEELKKAELLFNRMVVTYYHPPWGPVTSPNEVIGLVRNMHFEDNAIKGDIMIFKDQEEIIEQVKSGLFTDVSIGYYARKRELEKPIDYDGRTAIYEEYDLLPDHVAILPNGLAACPKEQGCGIDPSETGEENQNKIITYTYTTTGINTEIDTKSSLLNFNEYPLTVAGGEYRPDTIDRPTITIKFEGADSVSVNQPGIPDLNIYSPFHELKKEIQNALESNEKWTREYINSLPNSSFAVIEPAYLRGETKNKNARHLPHHNEKGGGTKNVNLDLPHLRNAFARVNQIKPVTGSITREELIRRAKNHLNKHASALKTKRDSLIKYIKSVELTKDSWDCSLVKEVIENHLEEAKNLLAEIENTLQVAVENGIIENVFGGDGITENEEEKKNETNQTDENARTEKQEEENKTNESNPVENKVEDENSNENENETDPTPPESEKDDNDEEEPIEKENKVINASGEVAKPTSSEPSEGDKKETKRNAIELFLKFGTVGARTYSPDGKKGDWVSGVDLLESEDED